MTRDARVPLWLGRTVFALCLLAQIAIILSLRVYPFVDLPFHLAAATIYHESHDPNSFFSAYFIVRPLLFEPNVLHLLITGYPFNHALSVDAMNRLVLCGYVATLPLIVYALIRRVGGNEWFALLVFPLIFNFNVAWGFVGFVMAIPLALLLLYWMMAGDRHSSLRTGLICAGGLILLYYTHVLAMLFTATVLALSALVRGRDERRMWWILPALIPAVVLTFLWWFGRGGTSSESTLTFLARYYRTEYFQHFIALRRRVLTNDNTQLFAGALGVGVALALSLPIVVPTLVALVKRRQQAASLFDGVPRRVLAVFTLVALGCCLLLPDRIPDQTALYERFGVLLLLSMVLWSSILYVKISRRLAVVLCVIALGSTAVRLSYFAAFARDASAFTPDLLPDGSSGRTLLGLLYDERFRGHPAYKHFPDYYITWRHGIAATELTQFRFGTVRANPQGINPPRFVPYPTALIIKETKVDYLLVRGTSPTEVQSVHRFRMLRSSDSWYLYENPAR
jgi:hypothetical protein